MRVPPATPKTPDSNAVLRALGHAVAVIDAHKAERPLLFVNHAFAQLTGYTSDELLAGGLLRLAGADSDPVTTQQLRTAINAVQPFAAEWLIHRKDGKALWTRVTVQPVPEADGAGSIAITLEDISRYKQARESLRASEARLEVAMEASELSMWDWNVERDEVYYNDRWRAALGIDTRELLAQEALSARLLLPADQPAVLERFEHHYRGRTEHFDSEYELIARDGSSKWFHAFAKVVRRDAQGNPQRMIGVLCDVTARRSALHDAIESEQRWERAVRGTSDGLYDWDLLTGHVWYAARFREIIGYDARDFPDTFQAFQNVLHADDRPVVMGKIRAHLENQADLDLRCRITKPPRQPSPASGGGGQVLWCRLRGEAERDAAGRPVRIAGSLSDMTAQIEAEKALAQSQKMEAVGRLTGGIAHDFNNLLSVIVGNMQLLARSLRESPRLLRQAETALNAALRGADLTRRLLAFARQQPLEPKVVDLPILIGGMYELLRRALGEVEIRRDLSAGTWATQADPGQLENAVLNLVINARDAMPSGGVITLATRNVIVDSGRSAQQDELIPGEYAVLEVTDTGVGMSAETLKRACEPFFTTKDVGRGTGLGLSMVYGFVKQSGGHMEILSAPGRGTSVLLYLPRARAGAEHSRVVAALPGDLPRGSEMILVVEDDMDVRATALELLGSLGYRAVAAGNGHEALALFAQNPDIALVFSDIMLPGGLLGLQLVQKLTEQRPGLKVLMTSGFNASGMMHRALLDGTIELLPKPYRLEELARRVRATLDEEDERVPA